MQETRGRRTARLGLAGFLAAMTYLHVAHPKAFVAMVPRWLPGERRHWNTAAAAAEGVAAALLVRRRTARTGGRLAALAMLAVYPANLEAVRRGGYRGMPGWLGSRVAAIARLPLQVPLVWWAWSVARAAERGQPVSSAAKASSPPS